MRDFQGRVAVVTGAASGIGRGLAERFAREGMRVVLADVEKEPLALSTAELQQQGHDVLAVETDVADLASVEALRDAAIQRYGRVHVLCNNAGVSGGGGGPLWAATPNDWRWVTGVNLMGVVHGLQAFVPSMLEHGEEGHIINTSSVLGLGTGGGSIYGVTKHAVTRLTEGLYYDLQAHYASQPAEGRIGVSVLCPGLIATRILEADRNRPALLRNEAAATEEMRERRQAAIEHWARDGMSPAEVADTLLAALREDRFYILTHPEYRARVEERMHAILHDTPPPPLPATAILGGAGPSPGTAAGPQTGRAHNV